MKSVQLRSSLFLLISTLTLTACGGGGGGGTTVTPPAPNPGTGTIPVAPDWVAGQFPAESTLKNFCAAPRSGLDPYSNTAYPDKAGTAAHEKMWLRSWSNRTYLWYRELSDINPSSYTTADYFKLLRTTAVIDSGAVKDKYHYQENTAEYKKRTQSGVTSGYGISWKAGATAPPRDFVIAFTESASPAVAQNLGRGAKLLEVDGVDFVNDNTQAGVDKINAGLFPAKAGESHQFTFADQQGVRRSYTLVSADVPTSPVQNVKVIDSPRGKVGYLQFNSHIANAQPQLIDAINKFKSDNVSELVIDLRYNGGGLLALAGQFGYMVAGPNIIQGRYFEKTLFNDKYPNTNPETGSALQPMPFYGKKIDYQAGVLTSEDLPVVGLSRIFVLSTANTCSASEAFINALRGVDLEVILIGSKTCGKPYGFYPTDNCGVTYSTIQFSGVNAKGFGEYADGLRPAPAPQFAADVKGCAVADDLTRPLGDSNEKMFSAALQYMSSGTCPVQTQTLAQALAAKSAAAAIVPNGLEVRDPNQDNVLNNKIYQPEIKQQ
ncbi:peptidase [Rheinheimera sp. SA_1]|uniref:S41 family peptidase n=1 Tax=Rheinheimera sp. SA_1 TaxID=1827365 RepID=UPI0007FD48DB|nr:S41 family peptidase [Rheinheimera sp. SA_1]OBP13626.1 peptidase [Rheinheimera sp. SA_1]